MAKSPARATARRAPLSRERVLRAAVDLADQEGIAALSMRRLAQALGVEAMSLYNHVASKDEVLDGMVELIVGEIELPTPGGRRGADWRDAMRRRALSAHAVLLRHPWASMLMVSRMNVGPATLRLIDATLGCLHQAGFSYAMADHAWNALDSHLHGFTLQKLSFPLAGKDYAAAAKGFVHMLPVEQYPHMRALTEMVIAGEHSGMHDFVFGLDLLLDGLERLRTASPR